MTLKPSLNIETEGVIVTVKLGPNWNFDKNQFMLFPLSISIMNDIDQSKREEPSKDATLQIAGRMFVSPPPVKSSKGAAKSTRCQF